MEGLPGSPTRLQDSESAPRGTPPAEGAAWGGGDSSSGGRPARLGAVGEVGPPSHLVETAGSPNAVASCQSSQQGSDMDPGILESCFFPGCCLDNGSEGARVEMEGLDRRLRQSSVVAGTRPGRE